MTAFIIESYTWLQEDPSEKSTQLLAQISLQLSTLVPNNTSFNFAPPDEFVVTQTAIRINIFWFTSLTLSLTAVLVGILCKQWLREYQRYEGLPPKDAFPVRQMRYEGLVSWHVPKILSSLPLLLQAALVLFFAGILDLLWSLQSTVASVITAVVGISLLFLVTTSILPCLHYLSHFSRLQSGDEPQPQCAYKSPQSWAFHLLATSIISLCEHLKSHAFGITAVHYLQLSSWFSDSNWVKYDVLWQRQGRYIERGVSWFDKTFTRNVDAVYHIYHCLESLENYIAAGCVSRIIEETWDPLVPLVGLILPTLEMSQQLGIVTEDAKSVTRDLTLTSFLVVHLRADVPLPRRCIEQCLRILNTSTDETSVVLEVLNIVISSAQLSEGTRCPYFVCTPLANDPSPRVGCAAILITGILVRQ